MKFGILPSVTLGQAEYAIPVSTHLYKCLVLRCLVQRRINNPVADETAPHQALCWIRYFDTPYMISNTRVIQCCASISIPEMLSVLTFTIMHVINMFTTTDMDEPSVSLGPLQAVE